MALAVYSADAIAGSAFATQEILHVLVPVAAMAAIGYVVAISGVVVVLLLIVVSSYRQTIFAYPSGGGSYIVSRENLGVTASLFAGASLLVDDVLTVAVSIAAGVAAIASAIEPLRDDLVPLALVLVALLALANLRGLKESDTLFAFPTYAYIAVMGLLIVVGLVRTVFGGLDPPARGRGVPGRHHRRRRLARGGHCLPRAAGVLVGCGRPLWGRGDLQRRALVPAARERQRGDDLDVDGVDPRRAVHRGGVPHRPTRAHAERGGGDPLPDGGGPCSAAPTRSTSPSRRGRRRSSSCRQHCLRRFPRLSSIIAGDGFLSRQLRARGDRLVFSNGIIALALASAVLLVAFRWRHDAARAAVRRRAVRLVHPVRAGMVQYHRRHGSPGWQRKLAINALGAAVCLDVLVVVIVSKFTAGAWIDDVITVVLPEFVLTSWWGQLLHNQSALGLKLRLLFRRNTVVVSIPTYEQGDVSSVR